MVKEIPISNKPGMVALVDDEDFPLVSRYSWTLGGQKDHPYVMTNMQMLNGKRCVIYLHKFIMGGFGICDHKSNDYLDCQKENLRRATYQQNGWNSGKPKGGRFGKCSSQYKGVVRCVAKDGTVYFRVIIKITKKGVVPAKFIRLGPFATDIEAAKVYNREIVPVRGEWAWLNPIPGEAA